MGQVSGHRARRGVFSDPPLPPPHRLQQSVCSMPTARMSLFLWGLTFHALALVLPAALGAAQDHGRLLTHSNGTLLITSPGGQILLDGHDPVALCSGSGSDTGCCPRVAVLEAENAGLKQSLEDMRGVVAGLGTRQWAVFTGTSGFDRAVSSSTDAEGNVYVVGETEGNLGGSSNAGLRDAFVHKYSGKGVKLWERQLGSPKDDIGTTSATDSTGNVFVCGTTSGGLEGLSTITPNVEDLFIVKFNSSGDQLWIQQFGSAGSDNVMAAATDADGSIILVGKTLGDMDGYTNAGQDDAFVAKFNSMGQKEWIFQFGTSSVDRAHGVATDAAGNIFVSGQTKGGILGMAHIGLEDSFVVKFASNGSQLWSKQFGTTTADISSEAATDAKGNLFLLGYVDAPIWLQRF